MSPGRRHEVRAALGTGRTIRLDVPTLSSFFAIYTEGESLHDSFPSPAGTDVFLGEMGTLILPGARDELFGPHAGDLPAGEGEARLPAGLPPQAQGPGGDLLHRGAHRGAPRHRRASKASGLDVLRLAPFPLQTAHEALPEDLLAEDLFSVGFTEMGEHGVRAETIGFSKLGQREITFEFTDRALMEEAALMCGHLADWLLDHNKRIVHGQSMSFGFDRLTFFSAEGAAGGPFRGWHPPLVQKLVPRELFPGVGVLEVHASPPGNGEQREDLTVPLRRALEQRMLLEESRSHRRLAARHQHRPGEGLRHRAQEPGGHSRRVDGLQGQRLALPQHRGGRLRARTG